MTIYQNLQNTANRMLDRFGIDATVTQTTKIPNSTTGKIAVTTHKTTTKAVIFAGKSDPFAETTERSIGLAEIILKGIAVREGDHIEITNNNYYVLESTTIAPDQQHNIITKVKARKL